MLAKGAADSWGACCISRPNETWFTALGLISKFFSLLGSRTHCKPYYFQSSRDPANGPRQMIKTISFLHDDARTREYECVNEQFGCECEYDCINRRYDSRLHTRHHHHHHHLCSSRRAGIPSRPFPVCRCVPASKLQIKCACGLCKPASSMSAVGTGDPKCSR